MIKVIVRMSQPTTAGLVKQNSQPVKANAKPDINEDNRA
jgi:hypothetical protein